MIAGVSFGFTAPWLLLALAVLPVLWILLRAMPPAPIRRRFPAVVLMLGLKDKDTVTDRTPWWLLLLRTLALAAVIFGLAGPVLNPKDEVQKSDPLLILIDGGWASATSWRAHLQVIETTLDDAARQGRSVALVRLTTPSRLLFQTADIARSRLPGFGPQAWQPVPANLEAFEKNLGTQKFDTYWMSDGLELEGRQNLLTALEQRGEVRVFESGMGLVGLETPSFDDGKVVLTLRRSHAGAARSETVLALGLDPAGAERVLASAEMVFTADQTKATVQLAFPSELRSRMSRFEVQGMHSAGTVALSDDSLRQREVALIAGRQDREGLQLLSPLHYLRQAFQPSADVLEGTLGDILPANPDVIVLADVAVLSASEEQGVLDWVNQGGLLLRFAGPRLAASDLSRTEEHPLMPVRLRAGGRSVGGAMSWGAPKSLAPFTPESPFFGLTIPEDVKVSSQVVAQPDPTLAARVIAELSDGTPLVSRKPIGQGQVVLFHVTANAQWSGLPLSGLFVQMLDRLAILSAPQAQDEARMSGTVWQSIKVLDGEGRLQDGQSIAGVAGERLMSPEFGPDLLPGLYQDGNAVLAVNVVTPETVLTPAKWPVRISVEDLVASAARDLTGVLLAIAVALLITDVFASLLVSGRFWGQRIAGVLVAVMMIAPQVKAQQDPQSGSAKGSVQELVLGHILTGNSQVDDIAHAGLRGLSNVLAFRTSIEPSAPQGVDLERDELAFYPFLYWPITTDQPTPSRQAYASLNAYLRSGGMILFDTRDADIAGFGAASPNGRKLQKLAGSLDIPPLDPLPQDHVLTRAFYLLQDFPGRYDSHDVWVEAVPADAEKVEGMPFRNLNDGVTPVVFGGNDWAAAWAVDRRGNSMFPVGRGRGGERQRELAYRFGINLIMHVLTGNYKSDQVHVPALLDRLGQ